MTRMTAHAYKYQVTTYLYSHCFSTYAARQVENEARCICRMGWGRRYAFHWSPPSSHAFMSGEELALTRSFKTTPWVVGTTQEH